MIPHNLRITKSSAEDTLPAPATAAGSDPGGTAAAIVIWLLLVIGYWVPTIVAFARRIPGKGQVVVVNLLLGWTVIGWIIALVMAFRARPHSGPAPVWQPPPSR